MTGKAPATLLVELRAEFPGWRIQCLRCYSLPGEARRHHPLPRGGIAHLVAADAEYLRELLTAATVINSRPAGLLP